MAVQGVSGFHDNANEIFAAPKKAKVPLVHPREGGLITSLVHYGTSGHRDIIFKNVVKKSLLCGGEQGSDKCTNCFFSTMLCDGVEWSYYTPTRFVEKWMGTSNKEPFVPFNWPYKGRSEADTLYVFDVGLMIEEGVGPLFTASSAVIGPDNQDIPPDSWCSLLSGVLAKKSGGGKEFLETSTTTIG